MEIKLFLKVICDLFETLYVALWEIICFNPRIIFLIKVKIEMQISESKS